MNNPKITKDTIVITQDMFPGAWIETKWSKIRQIKCIAYYTMRSLLGAVIVNGPRGYGDFVSMIFEGKEYIIHRDNWRDILEMRAAFLATYILSRGYEGSNELPEKIRYSPDFLIDGLATLNDMAQIRFDVPPKFSRMFWVVPDAGACGEYRSRLPYEYMKSKFSDLFYTERMESTSEPILSWFEVMIMHRTPPQGYLNLCQNMKIGGKFLVYEFDDDVFNLPDWNPNHTSYNRDVLKRSRMAIEMSDIVIASTESLMNIANKQGSTFHGPNLIEPEKFTKLKCDREFNKLWKGYRTRIKSGKVEYFHKSMPTREMIKEDFEPVKILWTGSPTHDRDLEQIIPVIEDIGKEYGLAIQFIFFGYIPTKFINAYANPGNTNIRTQVKESHRDFISHIAYVEFSDFHKVIDNINPDFALCPLCDDIFNMSKSNLKVLEMGGFGIPCIATDFGPYEFIEHGVDGLKVPVDNQVAWKEAIELMIKDSSLRKSLGQAIYERTHRDFSWGNQSENTEKWDTIFNEIHSRWSIRKDAVLKKARAFFEKASQVPVQENGGSHIGNPEAVGA